MRKEAQRIAKGIFDGTLTSGSFDPTLTDLVAQELMNGVVNGFGKDFPELDSETPDYAMLQSLEKNVFHFSAAKNVQQIKSMSLALRDEQGRLRTFEEFRDEAMKISDEYLGNWLRTEYDTAIAAGQMAGKWIHIQEDKELFPYLLYRTVGDSHVRPSHQLLEGIVRRVDDTFWDVYFPPNGWNCRCDVDQLESAVETPFQQIPAPDDVPPMFRVNLAKRGLIFPPDHPYWLGVSDDIYRRAEQLIKHE